jgi:urease accessory protein
MAQTLGRATRHAPAGSWPHGDAVATVTLAFDDRHRRRIALTTDDGRPFVLDLGQAHALRAGDGLALEGGGWIAVVAAPEPLLEITARDLVRVAWHLGNRHLPVQILDGSLRIRDDHVIAAMLRGLGAEVRPVSAPFDPEGGAYSGGDGQAHGHDHGNGHDHHHHGHDHDH